MAAKTTARKAKAKAAPVEPEVSPEEDFDSELVEAEIEDEEGDDELEELEEDEVADESPAAKGKKKSSANDDITFGIQDLCALVKKETGDDVNPRGMRTLIRKMARDESGRVDREIVPGNRSRYNWTGPNDPEVRAILDAYKGGELEAEKKSKLDALKAKKAAGDAAKKAAKAAAVEEDDDEDETPAPKKTAKKTAAPAAKKRRKAPATPVVEVEDDDEELDLDDDE